jgi:hypothetical protein
MSRIDASTAPRAPIEATAALSRASPVDDPLWQAALELESALAAELFAYAGLDEAVSRSSGLGGAAFSNFVVQSYAETFVAEGGLGLAETIYRQLQEKSNGR